VTAQTRVVVVESNAAMREIVTNFLSVDPGIDVISSHEDASGARANLEPARPDVVVLDFRSSDVDGTDLCREIRERMPSVHCIIFTGWRDSHTEERAFAAGASAIVLKGDSLPELASTIKRLAVTEPPPLMPPSSGT
jgi:two-component system, NarL family, response regulator DevR